MTDFVKGLMRFFWKGISKGQHYAMISHCQQQQLQTGQDAVPFPPETSVCALLIIWEFR